MLEFKKGIIYKNGGKIGTIKKDFQYGYHPAVIVYLDNGNHKWFELVGRKETEILDEIKEWLNELS